MTSPPATDADLAIDGGTIVTPGGHRTDSIYVAGGRIAAIDDPSRPAKERVDATGLLVLPGFIDAHVHLMDPGAPEREDWEHGTAAAVASGVTTVLEHTHFQPVLTVDDLAAKASYVESRARVDYGLAAHVFPDNVEQIGALAEAGACFFKVFTCTTHGVPGLDSAALLDALRAASAAGAIVLAHCEDERIVAAQESRLRAAERADGGTLPEWRSREAEVVAATQVLTVAWLTEARVVIAHVSNRQVLDLVDAARDRGAEAFAETCPQYLVLLEEEVHREGPLRKFTPPARARSQDELEAMWEAVAGGAVAYVSSDHAPATRSQKQEAGIWEAPFGLPGLDTTSSILIDAALRGAISFERLAAVYSEVPASLYGLAPRKGRLEPGADADVVLIDPDATRTIEAGAIRSKAGWSPYEGRSVRGAVVGTYLRGNHVFDGASILAEPGLGMRLDRGS